MKTSRLIISIIVVCFCSFSSMAEGGKCGQNQTWSLDKNGHLIIRGTGDMNNFSADDSPWIPQMVRTIEIEEGVRTIGKNAFAGAKIVTLVLPSSVELIGENAFKGCRSLASVTLPYGLQTISKGAFSNCTALPKITLPSTVSIIGDKAFSGCENLMEISVPSRIKAIGNNAFKKCKHLDKISELPDFVTVSNAYIYGLMPYSVEDYYSNRSSTGTFVSATLATPKVPEKSNNKRKLDVEGLEYGLSDVDAPLPVHPQNNRNSFAFIIANENYSQLSDVPFAHNDGNSFATYCAAVLGIPDDNINLIKDATSGAIKGAIGYLKDIDEAFNGDIDVIFYYAGHGAPSDNTKDAYLVPVDAANIDSSYCYALDDLYDDLSDLKANSVKVFLDACFSGPARDNSMVEKARKVAVVPKKANLKGNIVVLTAASDDQTAWQYNSQGHGLFTYFLLKKLRETGGDVTLGELSEYINSNVMQTSVVVNRKRQNPSVSFSPAIGQRWRTWRLK